LRDGVDSFDAATHRAHDRGLEREKRVAVSTDARYPLGDRDLPGYLEASARLVQREHVVTAGAELGEGMLIVQRADHVDLAPVEADFLSLGLRTFVRREAGPACEDCRGNRDSK
jgi:hypothetical protein